MLTIMQSDRQNPPVTRVIISFECAFTLQTKSTTRTGYLSPCPIWPHILVISLVLVILLLGYFIFHLLTDYKISVKIAEITEVILS